jgi:hypothetical protein
MKHCGGRGLHHQDRYSFSSSVYGAESRQRHQGKAVYVSFVSIVSMVVVQRVNGSELCIRNGLSLDVRECGGVFM